MQQTSALYRRLLTDENHWFESKVSIGGIELTEERIFSIGTNTAMFSGNPEVGTAISAEIDLSLLNPDEDIPAMGEIIPYVRVCTATEQSEWLKQGVFYIDTRENSHNSDGLDIMNIHGYDAMMKTEADYADTALNFPAKDMDIVHEIAGKIGVTVDERTVDLMTGNYRLPLPASYSMREMLGYIASMYVGCFIMTEVGQLRLVSLLELPEETRYLTDSTGDAIVFGGDRILV